MQHTLRATPEEIYDSIFKRKKAKVSRPVTEPGNIMPVASYSDGKKSSPDGQEKPQQTN